MPLARSILRLWTGMLCCAIFAGAALLLTGCGGEKSTPDGDAPGKGGDAPEQRGCSDFFVFPSTAQPSGEHILLNFTHKTCCKDLAGLVDDGRWVVLVSSMRALGRIDASDVPPALLEAARPLCQARCLASFSGCRTSARGRMEACESSQLQEYVRLLEYVCSKVSAPGRMTVRVRGRAQAGRQAMQAGDSR